MARIDIHTHTARYSACSIIDPHELIRRVQEIGLDGLALTEHDTLWEEDGFEELKAGMQKQGFLLINAIEVRCYNGKTIQGDFLVFGCRDSLAGPADAKTLVSRVRRRGGAIIAAHPFRELLGIDEQIFELDIDAVEVYSSNHSEHSSRLALDAARKMGKPMVAGSDAHRIEAVGTYVTLFEGSVSSEEEFVERIKKGACTALRI